MRLKNPYLNKVSRLLTLCKKVDRFSFSKTVADLDRNPHFTAFRKRKSLVEEYAWAIPNSKAIKEIAKYGPFVKIGAGNGYWSYLLSQQGVEVKAFDLNPWKKTWVEVKKGHPEKLKIVSRFYNLFLCWPPYDDGMAKDSLNCFKGKYIVYVGEPAGGCTADNFFHSQLKEKFSLIKQVKIPQWPGIHDQVFIYKRNGPT